MFLSIIIPAYNESAIIEDSLKKIGNFLSEKDFQYEIILVNDGSTDDTLNIVTLLSSINSRIRVINISHKGKGAAVKKGILESKAKWNFLCDADLSMSIDQLDKFLTLINQDSSVDIIISNRSDINSNVYKEPPMRHYLGIIFNIFVRLLLLKNFHDTQCGFKLFKNSTTLKIFKLQKINGFCFDVEILYLANKFKKNIKQIPIEWHYNSNSSVRIFNGSKAFIDLVFILIFRIFKKYEI
jgi:dolichyl-phosphate beta-glucosyltransferase